MPNPESLIIFSMSVVQMMNYQQLWLIRSRDLPDGLFSKVSPIETPSTAPGLSWLSGAVDGPASIDASMLPGRTQGCDLGFPEYSIVIIFLRPLCRK